MRGLKLLLCCLFVLNITMETFAQETEVEKLSEVVIVATNYKYLNEVDNREAAIPVKMLQRKVASFDLKNSDFYEDEYDDYFVSFYIPEGKILAAYNKDGQIIRTIERYKNIKMAPEVAKSLAATYPGWKISKDIYRVTFHTDKGSEKEYKFILEKDGNTIRVKTDENGKFL